MFESVLTLLAEHDELQSQLADPELHANPARSKKVKKLIDAVCLSIVIVVVRMMGFRTLGSSGCGQSLSRKSIDLGLRRSGNSPSCRRYEDRAILPAAHSAASRPRPKSVRSGRSSRSAVMPTDTGTTVSSQRRLRKLVRMQRRMISRRVIGPVCCIEVRAGSSHAYLQWKSPRQMHWDFPLMSAGAGSREAKARAKAGCFVCVCWPITAGGNYVMATSAAGLCSAEHPAHANAGVWLGRPKTTEVRTLQCTS